MGQGLLLYFLQIVILTLLFLTLEEEEIQFYINIYFGFLDTQKYIFLFYQDLYNFPSYYSLFIKRKYFWVPRYNLCYSSYCCSRLRSLSSSYIYCRNGCGFSCIFYISNNSNRRTYWNQNFFLISFFIRFC